MRVWIDITNSPHVLFFRPLVRLLQADGHDVTITAREYAQTLELLELHDLKHEVVGPRHGGAGVLGKARALAGRLPALRRFARSRSFDFALGHGSHELTLAARSLGIPSATAHDYEFASLQHHLGLRAATRVVFPEAVPAERLARFGVRPPKLVTYPGIKEEYYLSDFEPERASLGGIDPAQVLVVVRTPPDVSLYHRHGNPLFGGVLERLGRDESVHAVVLPRTSEQRRAILELALPSLHVPEHAVDAQSLVALADLVVSAGGTMNREAAALGTPAYTTFTGRLGGVDETLIREGRLVQLRNPVEVAPRKRSDRVPRPVRRDPRVLLDLMLPPQPERASVSTLEPPVIPSG
jgi:predicted glycosyltransferase